MRTVLLLAAASLALSGCGDPAEEADDPAVAQTPIPVEPGADGSGGIGDGAGPPVAAADKTPGQVIPAALQGRWGMVPADCTSTRGEAKGLLTVGANDMRFYESVATLALETARSEAMIRGQWEFEGEGMTWTRDETLVVEGDTLTRTSSGGEEPGSKGPFTYTRCAA